MSFISFYIFIAHLTSQCQISSLTYLYPVTSRWRFYPWHVCSLSSFFLLSHFISLWHYILSHLILVNVVSSRVLSHFTSRFILSCSLNSNHLDFIMSSIIVLISCHRVNVSIFWCKRRFWWEWLKTHEAALCLFSIGQFEQYKASRPIY